VTVSYITMYEISELHLLREYAALFSTKRAKFSV
jgi:hypothetical protein